MTKPKDTDIDFLRRMEIYARRGITVKPAKINENMEEIHSLQDRLDVLLDVIRSKNRKTPGNMVYLILYDIENNQVRTKISKYLERKGCTRIQKSVFIADLKRDQMLSIRDTLSKINGLYQNQDSIIIIPVAEDALNGIQVIGKTIEMDLALYRKNVLFI